MFRLYYCPAARRHRDAEYLGVYANKTVRSIGYIAKIVACRIKVKTRTVSVVEGPVITDDERDRILGATEEAKAREWDLTEDHKFYLCDTMEETDFRKVSPTGIRRSRYFDLGQILHVTVLPDELSMLATMLRDHEWR